AAVEIAVDDPYLAAPSLGHNPHRLSCSVHRNRIPFSDVLVTPRQMPRRHTRQPRSKHNARRHQDTLAPPPHGATFTTDRRRGERVSRRRIFQATEGRATAGGADASAAAVLLSLLALAM